MTSNPEPTPQERLAASRQAILRLMNARGEPHDTSRDQSYLDDGSDMLPPDRRAGVWQSIRRALRVWWHNHPAQLALELGRPLLTKYAEEKPVQLLCISAAAGAAIVLSKPWRLVSLTGLAVAAVKSSQVSGLLLSLLTTPPESPAQDNHN